MNNSTEPLDKAIAQANLSIVLLDSIKESTSKGDKINIKNLKCIKSNLYEILSAIQELETKED